MQRFFAWTLVGLLLSSGTALAQTSYPMLMSLKPTAIQAGTSAECEVQSRYSMRGAHTVFVSGEGVTAEVIDADSPAPEPGKKPADITKLKLKITATPDALPGPREFRLATPYGASTIGQLVVVRDPVVAEQAANDTLAQAQTVTLPATLCGTIEKAEDSDFWKFSAEAGQAVVFHVLSQRLEDKIHDLQTHVDPILFLRTTAGDVLAMSDNHFFADPFLTYTFKEAGDYVLEIRDVRYQGNVYWEYCIEAHSRPHITQTLPLAVAAESETSVALAGVLVAANAQGILQVPAGLSGMQRLPVKLGEDSTNPVPVYVTGLPRMDEPAAENDSIEQAVPVTLPVVINGRIDRDSDLDVYAFEAKKGDLLTFEVLARRLNSELDSYLRILNDKGQPLREEDDSRFGRLQWSDTLIDGWLVPADGKYFVEIRDVHLRGGAGFGYALQIAPSQPGFELAIDTDKTLLTPGTHAAIFVRAIRKHGFTGEIQLDIDGLPEGVFATCGRILAGKGQDGAIVLGAEPNADLNMARVTIRGTAVHPRGDDQPPLELAEVAAPYQEIYMPGGGRSHFVAEDHVVCVGAPSDIRSITLSDTDIRLKPGASHKLIVKIERAPEATANISLDFIYQHLSSVFANTLPEGVTIDMGQSKTLLSGGATEGHIVLKAADTAPPVEKQVCSLMAHFSINFVMKRTYCGPPVFLSIEAAAKD